MLDFLIVFANFQLSIEQVYTNEEEEILVKNALKIDIMQTLDQHFEKYNAVLTKTLKKKSSSFANVEI